MNKPPPRFNHFSFPRLVTPLKSNVAPQSVLQTKVAVPSAQGIARNPVAPPVYRPQPVPKVMQTKSALAQLPQPEHAPRQPVAPTFYDPKAKKLVQPKAGSQMRAVPQAPPVYCPAQKRIAQPKIVSASQAHTPPKYIQINASVQSSAYEITRVTIQAMFGRGRGGGRGGGGGGGRGRGGGGVGRGRGVAAGAALPLPPPVIPPAAVAPPAGGGVAVAPVAVAPVAAGGGAAVVAGGGAAVAAGGGAAGGGVVAARAALIGIWLASHNATEQAIANHPPAGNGTKNIGGQVVIGSDADVQAYVAANANCKYLTAWLWNQGQQWSQILNDQFIQEIIGTHPRPPVEVASAWMRNLLQANAANPAWRPPNHGSLNKEVRQLLNAGYTWNGAQLV